MDTTSNTIIQIPLWLRLQVKKVSGISGNARVLGLVGLIGGAGITLFLRIVATR